MSFTGSLTIAPKEWSDAEVARRWLMLWPKRRDEKRRPMEPTEFEINSIVNSKEKLATTIEESDFTSAQKRCSVFGVGFSENTGEDSADDEIQGSQLPEQNLSMAAGSAEEEAPSAERRVYGRGRTDFDKQPRLNPSACVRWTPTLMMSSAAVFEVSALWRSLSPEP